MPRTDKNQEWLLNPDGTQTLVREETVTVPDTELWEPQEVRVYEKEASLPPCAEVVGMVAFAKDTAKTKVAKGTGWVELGGGTGGNGGPHTHSEYAPVHTHPYSADTHTHPAHNHDAAYAGIAHTHPPSGVGSRFPQSISIGDYLVLTNVGATYDTIPAARGLGIALIDFTGVTRVEFRMNYNKIGTGTLSWQLWNETDGLEITRIDDATAAADNKSNTVAITAGIPLGVKRVRIRAKSTVAGDDPVAYGGAVLLS